MEKFVTPAKIITKIAEIFHWIAVGVVTVVAAMAFLFPELIASYTTITSNSSVEGAFYGLEVSAPVIDGGIASSVIVSTCVVAAIVYALMAMIFRNMYLIIKQSENGRPFQMDNIRRLKGIGIFAIAIPIVELVASVAFGLIAGFGPEMDVSVQLNGIFMGIIVLCLTQFFIYGAKLQNEVDGLL